CKLKQNSIFKLGYEVKSLIDNFLDVEKSESYLDFSPLKMEISEYKGLFIDITEFESLTETELKNRFSEILKLDGNEIKFPIGTTVETFQAKNI
ncbi:hypothetical protein JR532_000726, partial [Listeria monocytogenes serotype 1/2a]|nr:hypothetical protein [Listeria monocytogenes serotype 1/2a]